VTRDTWLAIAAVGVLALWLALRAAPGASGPAVPAVAAAGETGAPAAQQTTRPARPPQQQSFGAEVRDFFDSAGALGDEERERRAAALRERITERERDGLLLPPEALMLRLALLRATIDDPAVLDHESRSLVEAAREAEAATRGSAPPDPRFAAYKQREAEIVREVMALDEVPGGLPRDEYLRRRLSDLRSELHGDASPEPDSR
jgi:hypothetical protein